jgi:hypothetical protein
MNLGCRLQGMVQFQDLIRKCIWYVFLYLPDWLYDDSPYKMTLLHSLKFPGKYLYRMCLTLCAIIRDPPFFRKLGKILVLYFGKYIFIDCGPMNNAGLTLYTYEKTIFK